MTSENVALNFLSHIAFPSSIAIDLLKKLNHDMSRLMICSHLELREYNLELDLRLRLLRAIRCFHMEKWSKYLMNHFQIDSFEKLIYHLLKCHIWIIYASWTLDYIRKYLIINQHTNLQVFSNKIQRLQTTINRLKQTIEMIKKMI